MKVGIITPHYPPNSVGGGAVSAELLARRLSSSNKVNSVTVFSFDGSSTTKEQNIIVKRFNCPLVDISEISNIYSYKKLKKELKNSGFDVLHSYNMALHPVTGLLSDKFDIPSVATLNSYALIPNHKIGVQVNTPFEWYKRLSVLTTGRIMTNMMKNVDQYIALSAIVRDIYRSTLLPEQPIDVIPNMYDPDFVKGISEGESDSTLSSKPNILYAGSLRKTKGVEYLVRSAQFLLDDMHIIIAGSGGTEQRLHQLSNNIGVSDQISFLGHMPHDSLAQLYADVDLFVHPGTWPEPFGRTILEAMQFGLPVVATNIGGPAEVVPQNSCLCEPKNPYDLAETIQTTYSHADSIGAENKQYVNETYSPDVVLPQIVNVYEKLINNQ